MGELMTNNLMERLSDNPSLLFDEEDDESSTSEEELIIKEDLHFDNSRRDARCSVAIDTVIGRMEMSLIMASRLKFLYVTHRPVELLTPEYLSDFSRAAFLLLYRYSYVDPGFRRQGYLAPKYFKAISKAFGDIPINLEAFASAVNTTIPSYCSLFPDVESPFGSRGSFFDLEELNSTDILIQASPPRIGSITQRAIEHSIYLLEKEDDTQRFIVTFTPLAWNDINKIIRNSGLSIWQNRVKHGDRIEYRNVIENTGEMFPMPLVTVLSNYPDIPLSAKTSAILDRAFSSF